MSEFIAIMLGVFKFWDQVTWLVKKLEGTPAENREKMIASVHAAFEQSRTTPGDTDAIEDIIAR